MLKRESEISTKFASAFEQLGSELSFAPHIEDALSAFDNIKIPKIEVNHCPADQ